MKDTDRGTCKRAYCKLPNASILPIDNEAGLSKEEVNERDLGQGGKEEKGPSEGEGT